MKEKKKKVSFLRLKDWKQKIKWEVEVDKMNCKWPWGRITINSALFSFNRLFLNPSTSISLCHSCQVIHACQVFNVTDVQIKPDGIIKSEPWLIGRENKGQGRLMWQKEKPMQLLPSICFQNSISSADCMSFVSVPLTTVTIRPVLWTRGKKHSYDFEQESKWMKSWIKTFWHRLSYTVVVQAEAVAF